MAIDEMLMESQHAPEAVPALRVYFWSVPAYSVGYFQSVAETVDRFDCREKDRSVVRRLSGGGLVEHGQDLTFSLVCKTPNVFLPAQAKESYLKINEAVRVGLKPVAPRLDYADCKKVPSGRATRRSVCFEAPSCCDLMLGSAKVVGASQRRKDGVLLHQSAVFLGGSSEDLRPFLREGFERVLGMRFEERPLSERELSRAAELEKKRYASSEWAFPVLSF